MCGRRNKSVAIGQCLKCHCEICDEPISECVGKQRLVKRDPWLRYIYN